MSHYEGLRAELRELQRRQAVAVCAPALAAALLFVLFAGRGPATILAALPGFALLPLVLHPLWRLAFPAYRTWSDRSSCIRTEIAGLRKRVQGVFGKYRERRKGEQFKLAYDLTGRTVRDLEEALSVGMFREQREVFVTAFVSRGVALRVTASIGSPFRCSAADNPALWSAHAERLDCDEPGSTTIIRCTTASRALRRRTSAPPQSSGGSWARPARRCVR